MFQTEISFDSKFFDSLKVRWLKTKEIYILLQTVDELINNNDIELTNYYSKQILYFMTVFKNGNKLQINTYKTNCPQVNGLNMCSKVDRIEV